MRKNTTLAFLILTYISFGQTVFSGKVVDSNKNPIPFCNVLLIDTNYSQNYVGGATDENGYFEIDTNFSGSIRVKISNVGFQEYLSEKIDINQNNSVFELGEISLSDKAFALNDVSVLAKKLPYKREIDRTVISLESEPNTQGSSVLDILERTPGVILDRQNNSLSMLGKDGVNVMINGKMTYMPTSALVQFLNGMSSDNVKTIELITTPPSKYDAEGNSGYINIELKKRLDEGVNGNLSATNSFSYNDNESQRSISGGVTASSPKNNINFNYSFMDNEIPGDGFFTRTYTNQTPFLETRSIFFNGVDIPSHNIRFSYDYMIKEKLEIGTSITGYSSVEDQNSTTRYEEGQDINYEFARKELKDWKNVQINLFANYKISENTNIEFSYDILDYENYTNYNALFEERIPNLPLEIFTEKESPFDIKVSKVDFESLLLKKIKITAGIKFVKSDFTNINSVNIDGEIQEKYSNQSILDEHILAGYSQANFDITKKIKIQAGFRYEYTDTYVHSGFGETFIDREYGNLFPSLFLGYKLNDFNNLNISYSKRISRPAFTDMAPMLIFLDLNTAVFGNLSLRPSYSRNYQIDYRYKSVGLSAQYSNEKDVFARFSPTIDTETNFITYSPNNLDKRETITAILNFPIIPIKIWKIRYFTSLSYSEVNGLVDTRLINNSITSLRFNMNNDLNITDSFTIQVVGFYQTKRNLNNGGYMRPMGKLDISAQKKLDENIILTLNGTNLLNTMKFRPMIDTPELNLLQMAEFNFLKPQAKITLTYNFGNSNVKTKKIKSAEESKRINTTGSN
tara:strand:+ start:1026 stop:3422 length:2397 start_codon:yes stop_codon:yes gene_type:complete